MIIHWELDDDDAWNGAELGWGKDTVWRCGALGMGPGEVVGYDGAEWEPEREVHDL